jgi:hypothetical protein
MEKVLYLFGITNCSLIDDISDLFNFFTFYFNYLLAVPKVSAFAAPTESTPATVPPPCFDLMYAITIHLCCGFNCEA